MAQKHRIESHNLDGTGYKNTRVYGMPPVSGAREYWSAVTDVSCPVCDGGIIRWAEAGYVPGHRICDGCGRHFLAQGTTDAPTLVRVSNMRGGFFFEKIRRSV